MPKIKKSNKAVINTTVNKEVLQAFRDKCDYIGCNMNVVLEAFMRQFAKGEFSIKLGKKSKFEVDLEE